MLGNATNPLLQKTEQAMQTRVGPGIMPQFQRIVAAGMKLMYSAKFHGEMLQQMHLPGDPAINAGSGVAKLIGILIAQSRGSMLTRQVLPAIGPAATVLLCEGLDFMEKAGLVKVTPDVLANATHEMSSSLMQLLGVTPAKLQAAGALARHAQLGPQGTPSPPAPAAPAQPQGVIAGAMGASQ